MLFGSIGLLKSHHESVWLTAGAVRHHSPPTLLLCMKRNSLKPSNLTMSSATRSVRICPTQRMHWNDVLGESVEGSRALLVPWVLPCMLWRSAEFSGMSFRPGWRECAGGSSSSRMQHWRPLLSPRVHFLVCQWAGYTQGGQGIQGAVWVHHHVDNWSKQTFNMSIIDGKVSSSTK